NAAIEAPGPEPTITASTALALRRGRLRDSDIPDGVAERRAPPWSPGPREAAVGAIRESRPMFGFARTPSTIRHSPSGSRASWAAAPDPDSGPDTGASSQRDTGSTYPSGWRSPSKRIDRHPVSPAFPPYSGAAYVPSTPWA